MALNKGIHILKQCATMATDYQHDWWFNPPYEVIYNPNLKFSYTAVSETGNVIIYLRRVYDIIHELLHVAFYEIDKKLLFDEQLAYISEIFELASLHCFPDFILDKYFI